MPNLRASDDWYGDDETVDSEIDNDAVELIPCPECGAEVYEEAEQCPECGCYIIAQTSPFAGRPVWWAVLGILGILMTIVALALYF